MSLPEMKIFTGNANPALAKEICEHLGVPLGTATVNRFPDGETFVQINENIRGCDVYVIQPTSAPANDRIMELLIMIDAAKRASAQRITAVLPFYGYARQDRKDQPRVPITAKLVANLIVAAGANRILTMDLHSQQIQGFFDIPVDNIYASPVLLGDLRQQNYEDLIVVSPDVGGVVRARALAKQLSCDLAIIDKRRPKANVSEVMHVIGDIGGGSARRQVCVVAKHHACAFGWHAVRGKGLSVDFRRFHPYPSQPIQLEITLLNFSKKSGPIQTAYFQVYAGSPHLRLHDGRQT